MLKSGKAKILKNQFSASDLQRIDNIMSLVNWKNNLKQIIQQIELLSQRKYLWLIGNDPAYFLQYQVKSCTLIKVDHLYVIVWKPKYIQYPSMVKFPQLGEKKLTNLKLTVDESSTKMNTETIQKVKDFIEQFYGTYFHSYDNTKFQQELVTVVKYFISKSTKLSYWHVALGDKDEIKVAHFTKSTQYLTLNIDGCKKDYFKTLLIFSYKGQRESMLTSLTKKWPQLLSFFSMLLIFLLVIGCNEQDPSGICEHKSTLMMVGATIMMGLMGSRIMNRKKAQIKQRKE